MSRAESPIYPYQPLDASGMPKFEAHSGMTLLEHYTGLAMQGLLANSNLKADTSFTDLARNSVASARALIAEMEKAQ